MKLKELDLDAPDAPKPQRLRFRSRSRTVSSLYERCLGTVAVRRGWKVLVECVPVVSRPDVRDLLGVLTIQVRAEIEDLELLGQRERAAATLKILHEGVTLVARAEGWDESPFEAARKCVEDGNFVNEWWWRKPKFNATRTLSAQLRCAHEEDAFRAWLVVSSRDGVEVARKQVLEVAPNEFEFMPLLGDLQWTDSNRCALISSNHSEVGTLEISRQ